MRNNVRVVAWVLVALLILSIALIKQFTDFGQVEVQWNEAFTYGIILLTLGGCYELVRWLKTRTVMYRIAFGLGLLGVLLLGWVSGAVGIIGSENNPANLMYWAVPIVGILGLLISRLKPRGMAYTLFAVAAAQFLVPIVALFMWPAQTSWGDAGVMGVFILNTIFLMLFIGSGMLFHRAAKV